MSSIQLSQIIEQMNWRYAVKKFDANKKLSEQTVDELLEIARLSASSFGLQPWKFVVVTNPEIRAKLREAAWGQSQITDASHLIVICRLDKMDASHVEHYVETTANIRSLQVSDLDGLKQYLLSAVNSKSVEEIANWNARQVYIPLGSLLEACALAEIDACPMEGFNPVAFDEILDLKEHGITSMALCAVGYRSEEDSAAHYKKSRFPTEEVVIKVD